MLVIMMLATWCLGPQSSLGDEIVAYARTRIGQKVGDGQCTALAEAALRHCHARRPEPAAGLWGDEVKALRELQPGDILQFESAVFVQHKVIQGGGRLTLTTRFPHHTAIVQSIRKRSPRPVLVILHQNAGAAGSSDAEAKVVHEWTLEMAGQRGGTVKAYRPVPERAAVPKPADP